MLEDLCPCFHQSPTKLCPDLVSFACWIVTESWSFARKTVPDLVVRALNCARFFVVRAINCDRTLAQSSAPNLICTPSFSKPSWNTVRGEWDEREVAGRLVGGGWEASANRAGRKGILAGRKILRPGQGAAPSETCPAGALPHLPAAPPSPSLPLPPPICLTNKSVKMR